MSAVGRFLTRVLRRPPVAAPAPAPAPAAKPTAAPAPLRGQYDSARTGPENRNHWAAAGDLSANAAASPEVRRATRRRARYERDNDPTLNGLTKTLAYDLVGTGPRLQLNLGEEHEADARLVEQDFARWCRAVGFTDKLRVMVEARPVDGETFGLFTDNPLVPHPVKLDLRVLEADQVATPFPDLTDPNAVDGIEFDAYGNPAFYHVLRQHPGDLGLYWGAEYDRVPARFVLHWFRPSRPGQARGVSEFAASLPVGSQTRRFSLAVLGAAEFAASTAGVLESDLPPPVDENGDPVEVPTPVQTWAEMEITRNRVVALPGGLKLNPFKAEQPTTGFKEFVGQQNNTIARPVCAPGNVVSGSSVGLNFSSGRLDHVPYHRVNWIERDRLAQMVLDRVFLAYHAEARLRGMIPDALPPVNLWKWDFMWDGFGAIDAVKDTQASKDRIDAGLSTLSEECAADGKNWRDVVDQRAVEIAYMRAKGVPLPAANPATMATSAPAAPADAADPAQQEDPADV